MSTTKVVKEIEKLRGMEDAPLVASGKLRSTDKERVLNQIDQRSEEHTSELQSR